MDLFVRSGGLPTKLVAGNIQNFQTLIMIIFIQLLNGCILGSKTAAGCGVHHQNHLASEFRQLQFLTFTRGQCIVVNHFHFLLISRFFSA